MLLPGPSRFFRSTCLAYIGLTGIGTLRFVVIALLAIVAAGEQIAFAQIATGTTGIDNTGKATNEMAACLNGKTQQAGDTCMTEVRNANAEKRAGKLAADVDLSANAMKRCEVFQKADDLAACKARVLAEQTAQGGVAAGGVLREVQTAVPASDASGVAVPPAKP